MPRIDPLKLLTCLKVLLAPNGGIRSANEVKRLAELMAKYSKKLVSKCIYIQILKSTDTELLGKFMGVGGWLLTHMWLSEGIRAANWPLVQEILELLLLCPVDIERLRSNTAPKLVKGLSKDGGNEGVRILATKLVEQWLKVVKGETMGSSELPPGSVPPAGIPAGGTLIIQQAGNKNDLQSPQQNSTQSAETMNSPNSKTDEGLVYKIVVKDGKQMLAKVNSSETESASQETVDGTSEASATIEDKQSDKENKKETEERDKDSDKEKSRSSKDKDRHRDHKSSSSSRHKSSSSSKSSSKSSSSSSSSKSKSSSSSSRHRDKDSSSDKDKHKSPSSSSSKSSSNHSSKDKDKDRSRSKDKDREREKSHSKSHSDKEKDKTQTEKSEKEKEKLQSEKDLAEIEKMTLPSIDKLGKIPKKPREEGATDPSAAAVPISIIIPSKKASMSIEIRRDQNRPKTVKTFNSQFRSHGLSEEAPPPPSRKGLKKPPAQPIPGTSIPPSFGSSTLLSKRLSISPPPSNGSTIKEPAEKKIKFDLTTAPTIEKPGAIKFIAPKPKPSTLVESDMFMDALSAAAPPKKDVRKRKRRSSSSKDSNKDGGSSEEPESPVANKVAPLKFYQDTLEDSEKTENLDERREDFNGSEERNDDEDDDIPLKKVKEQIEDRVREEKELEERRIRETEEPEENPVKKPPGPGCGPDGPPGVLMLHRRKGPKKKLTWRAQEQLEEIRFFELDETERVNVTKTFTDMKQMEHFKEREGFMLSRKLNADDVMVEQTAWTTPLIMVDDVPPHPEGSQSKEKKIQMERELTTLKALYFNRQMIPDSSAEPDMEQYQMTEPTVIPLDDITGNPDAINDFTSMPWPDPKGSPPPGEDFMGTDMGFPGGPFNPFMPFGANGGWMGPGMAGPPNGVMPPMGAPMGNFNGMMPGPQGMMMPGGPPMMMGSPNDMNMMPAPFGGPNFNGPPNSGMGAGFPNFGPPPMNMNPNNMNMNMNNGPPRGGQGGRGGGNWRSGSAGPPGGGGGGGGGGGSWRGGGGRGGGGRGGGGGGGGGGPGGRICKQFQRGYCRNGNKCNFFHPPGGANQRF